jgi:DNA-binding CsgD family transcriptional regulator
MQGWELSAIFSPALQLLNGYDIQTALLLRVISVLASAMTFLVCYWRANRLLLHRERLLIIGAGLALVTVASSMVHSATGQLPLAVGMVAWAAFGVGMGAVMLFWCLLFSQMPSRYTAPAVAIGGIAGTPLFAFVNTMQTNLVGLAAIVCLILASVAAAWFIATRAPWRTPPAASQLHRPSILTVPAALSICCQGVLFGFMSMMLCLAGPTAAVLGGLSGIIGAGLALVWGLLAHRIEMDSGTIQRISLPLMLAGIILYPLFGEAGSIACGCLVIMALAHESLYTWYATCIDNYEFQLHPISRFAQRQCPSWIGFFVGTLLAYLTTMTTGHNAAELNLLMALMAVVVAAVFSLYGGDERKNKQRLDELMNAGSAGGTAGDKGAVAPVAAGFRVRCEQVAGKAGLTPREAEVFYLLARGRTAGYIGETLVISNATVRTHIYHIYKKLGISSQQQLLGIVDERTDS